MGLKQASKLTHLTCWPKKWVQLNKDFGTFLWEVTSLLWKNGIPTILKNICHVSNTVKFFDEIFFDWALVLEKGRTHATFDLSFVLLCTTSDDQLF
jgi:hypothetical protein